MFTFGCGYCGAEVDVPIHQDLNTRINRNGGGRDWLKINCPKCNSRHAVDIKIRKIGKSAAIKKREKAKHEEWLAAGQKAYEDSADSVLTPWSSLKKEEQGEWAFKAAWARANAR